MFLFVRDNIASVLCLPLVSLQRSSHGHSDWTCIVAGFASGLLCMYTEVSSLIMNPDLFFLFPEAELEFRTFLYVS